MGFKDQQKRAKKAADKQEEQKKQAIITQGWKKVAKLESLKRELETEINDLKTNGFFLHFNPNVEAGDMWSSSDVKLQGYYDQMEALEKKLTEYKAKLNTIMDREKVKKSYGQEDPSEGGASGAGVTA